ncbi:hypothetical protein EDB19DRAFT_1898050 [Suillus lakei]|nr:hypothetical protein EDB19DRAFT_1898050 [Suillus lakei]
MVYTVPLIIFMDDVSGNISKQWNKHHTIYMSNASLPREMLDAAQSGVMVWDYKYNEEVMLIPYGLFLAGDHLMQAEECSHAGLSCNYFCRTCDVGGTKAYKESKAGYNSTFMSGNLRTPKKTSQEIQQQFETAFKLGATTKIQNSVSLTGVQDSASSLILNTLVELGKKLRKCTTGSQILHTILLGVVKYFWGQTVFLLEKAKFLYVFQYWLESINQDGLNAPCLNADYICHYKGSLIGKHFKSLAQVMPFIIHNLVPPTVLNAWTVIGELVVLVWHTRIMDTEAYLQLTGTK